jgi:WD40 repeat protein/tRNA A-37 threonylcarbamoyl transferase component Bud32
MDATMDGSSAGGVPGILDPISARRSADRVRYFGDYELVQEIARGGMGVVYKARQVSLNRTVALKMILAGRLASVAEEQRFRAEAEAAANLDNPNIVPLYEVGEYEGRQYFTMKLMDGGSLAQSISRNAKAYTQNPRSAAKLLAIVAGAVHYGHQRGILHRDLKPANVLLDSAGAPYVTDFGLAKRMDDGLANGDRGQRAHQVEATVSGMVVGTPAYMAPEQALGQVRQVTVATDVYGVGAILYHLLTGRPPFDRTNLVDVLRDVAEREPARPRFLNPKIDRDLETICLKALAKEPAGRYASAGALKEDLDHWLAGEPIVARRIGRFERSVKWARRNPAVATLLAMVAVSLLGGMAMVTWQWRRAESLRQVAETQRGVAETQRQRADDESRQHQRTAAGLALERGINYCEHDEIPRGVLWMARGLEMSGSDNPDFQWDARVNLSAWLPRLHALQHTMLLAREKSGTFERMGDKSNLGCIGYSRDGARLIVFGESTAEVWDTATGLRIGGPFAPVEGLFPAAIAPDGGSVFTSHPGRLITYDVATQKQTADREFDGLDDVKSMIISPDGARLVAACARQGKGVVRMWDLQTRARVGSELAGDEPAICLAMSADGSRLVAGNSKNATLWDLTAQEPVAKPVPHGGGVLTAAFRPDGLAFVTSGYDSMIRIWNAATLAPGKAMKHGGIVTCVAWSSDGKYLATTSHDYTVRLWDAGAGQQIGVPLFIGGWGFYAAFGPDGKTLAGMGSGAVNIWRLAEPPTFKPLPHESEVNAIAYSRDGRHVVTGGNDKIVQVWDADTGEVQSPPLKHDGGLMVAQFTSDGHKLITGDDADNICLWDWAKGNLQRKAHLDTTSTPWAMALSPDERKVFVSQKSHQAIVCDISSGKLCGPPLEMGNAAWTVAWSPDSSTLAIGTWSFYVGFYDANTLKKVGSLPRLGGAVGGLAFSPDSRRILAGTFAEKMARVWDVKSGMPVGPSLEQANTSVRGGAYSPDGKTVAVGSAGTVRLWDLSTGKLLGPALQHDGGARAIAYSPDGSHIAIGSGSGGRIWPIPAPMAGDPDAIRRRVEASTGFQLDGETFRLIRLKR